MASMILWFALLDYYLMCVFLLCIIMSNVHVNIVHYASKLTTWWFMNPLI